MNGRADERCLADRTFIVYCFFPFFSLYIRLFPVFKLIPTWRRICMHIRTYVYSTLWFCDLSPLPYHNTEGQTTRMEEGIGRRTCGLRSNRISLSLYHLQHHHSCMSASNASHGRSGNTPTLTDRGKGEVGNKAWGSSVGKWARSASGQVE